MILHGKTGLRTVAIVCSLIGLWYCTGCGDKHDRRGASEETQTQPGHSDGGSKPTGIPPKSVPPGILPQRIREAFVENKLDSLIADDIMTSDRYLLLPSANLSKAQKQFPSLACRSENHS